MKKNLLLLLCIFALVQIAATQNIQLWGTTTAGGTNGQGSLFKISPDGTGFTTVFNFAEPDGWNPRGNVLQTSSGMVVGTCYEGGIYYSCTIYTHDPSTNAHVDVHDFDIYHGDYPESGVIEGPNGILYGVASTGGKDTDSSTNYNGSGAIYSFNLATNTYTLLHEFDSTGGVYPFGEPLLVNNKLFGMTTYSSGTKGHIPPFIGEGLGDIYSFDITTNTYTHLHQFTAADGGVPYGSLIQHPNGKLYGMTSTAGQNYAGTIFSFDPANSAFQKIHDFNGSNGAAPHGSLLAAANGKLYGVTSAGGTNSQGVLFSFDVSNNSFQKLHDFTSATGTYPLGSLMEYGNNKLFGTASAGGAHQSGVLFSFDIANNTYTDLFNFNGTNGSAPNGGMAAVNSSLTGLSNSMPADAPFMVYPNPSSDKLNIILKTTNSVSAKITLTNSSGQVVLSEVENNLSGSLNKSIDLVSLSCGTYILELNADGKKLVKRIVIH